MEIKMKRLLIVLGLSLGLISTSTFGAAIVNGDFATCDLSGWDTSDDIGDPNLADFSVDGVAPDCAATMTIDDPNSLAVSNSLFQALDLTAAAGNDLVMSFDFSISTLLTDPLTTGGAFYSVFFVNSTGDNVAQTGLVGEIFNGEILGDESFSETFVLDQSFINASDWSIEFQIVSSFLFAESSSLTVNSVSLLERSVNVSAPASISFVVLSMFALCLYSRKPKISYLK